MAFKKVDCKAELQSAIKNNRIKAQYVEEFNQEYELIQSLIKARRKAGLTQKDVAKKSGLTQQMVSRIEKIDYSPTLINLMKYINAIGVMLNIKKI